MKPRYTIEITGPAPVIAECRLLSSAKNAAIQGLALRADRLSSATVTQIATCKQWFYFTNERGVPYRYRA